MENIIELNNSELITSVINRSFITVAVQFNLTKENAPNHPAFIGPESIQKQLDRGLKMYGYAVNDQIVGCAGYWSENNEFFHIERLATLPEHRHSGIGQKLLKFIENEIKNRGGKTTEVHVMDKNALLIEWYEKIGYVKIRVEKLKHLPFNSCVMNKAL